MESEMCFAKADVQQGAGCPAGLEGAQRGSEFKVGVPPLEEMRPASGDSRRDGSPSPRRARTRSTPCLTTQSLDKASQAKQMASSRPTLASSG